MPLIFLFLVFNARTGRSMERVGFSGVVQVQVVTSSSNVFINEELPGFHDSLIIHGL